MSVRPVLCFCVLFFCFRFSSPAQVRLFAGPQQTTAHYSVRNAKQSTDWKSGFSAGFGLINLIEGPLYFSPSLSVSRKGYKVRFDRRAAPPDTAAINNNTSINTVALAPLLQWNLSKKGSGFFLRLGPAVEVAFAGKEMFDKSQNRSVSRSMRFHPTAYSRTSFFANVHAGFEHRSGIGVFAHYEHGLSSLNNSDNGPLILNRVVGLSVQWTLLPNPLQRSR
jgi:hypothetical protein